jgi:hypothetical protein
MRIVNTVSSALKQFMSSAVSKSSLAPISNTDRLGASLESCVCDTVISGYQIKPVNFICSA